MCIRSLSCELIYVFAITRHILARRWYSCVRWWLCQSHGRCRALLFLLVLYIVVLMSKLRYSLMRSYALTRWISTQCLPSVLWAENPSQPAQVASRAFFSAKWWWSTMTRALHVPVFLRKIVPVGVGHLRTDGLPLPVQNCFILLTTVYLTTVRYTDIPVLCTFILRKIRKNGATRAVLFGSNMHQIVCFGAYFSLFCQRPRYRLWYTWPGILLLLRSVVLCYSVYVANNLIVVF